MYLVSQVKALKNGETVQKPIYNHVSGELDPPEPTSAPKVCTTAGLLPAAACWVCTEMICEYICAQ